MIFLLLFTTIPFDVTVSETVDIVEVNHFYDDNGRHVFDQVIFYDWDGTCVDWRLIKNESMRPNRCKMLWFDDTILRKITAKSQRETWTQYDPELVDRESNRKRRKLCP